MRKIVILMLLLLFKNVHASDPEIQQVKDLFEASAQSKASADRLSDLLANTGHSAPPLLICYKGAAEMMQAKYGFNPISKFKRFKRGKALIEYAVKKDPDDIAIRFLRFAIQTNLPAFLNYNDDINNDKIYLITHLKTMADKKLKQSIVKFLSASKYCTEEEKKGLAT